MSQVREPIEELDSDDTRPGPIIEKVNELVRRANELQDDMEGLSVLLVEE